MEEQNKENNTEKINKQQAGAELCQAHASLDLSLIQI